jgi:integrase
LEDPRPLDIPTNASVGKRKILQPNAVKVLFSDDTIMKYGKIKPEFFIHAYRFLFLIVLRRGEECGIKDEDIKDGVLHLSRAINRLGEETEGKNKNAIRDIVLPPTAIAVIEAQKAMLKKHGIISPWLFPDEHGNRLDSNHLYKMWRRYREQHDMQSTLHEIRHSAISALKSDLPLALMKPRIGHSLTMDTLGTYGHEVDGDAQRTADIMEEVYRRMIK